MHDMRKFPSIESFAHAYRDAVKGLTVRPKIKLHGTNGGIDISSGGVIAQSRNNRLTLGTDNAGFANWVHSQADRWAHPALNDCVVFGEWAGPGIQSADAVTKLPKRGYFVFAIYVRELDMMITDPEVISYMLPLGPLEDVYILPWAGETTHVDHANAGTFTETVNTWLEAIGESDPFIKETFGIDGPGERLVFMPPTMETLASFSASTFKVKTEAHRVRKSTKALSVKFDVPKDAVDFVKSFVTEPRLMQALNEGCANDRRPERTRDFLSWIGNDIRKESQVELEAMGVEWGQVAKHVAVAAREWFLRPAA